jgi:hypothetical protein
VKRPPPYLVRRLVIAPLFVVGAVLALTSIPLWLVVAAFVSRFVPGHWRILRVAWFLFLYVGLEAFMLVVLFVTWVATGFGWKTRSPRSQTFHYRLAGWWLRHVMGSARRTFKLTFDVENPADQERPDRPALMFSRHAGPGDSFVLVDAVLNLAGRHPRIVLKDMLQLDPTVDVILNRLPNRFVPSSGRAGDVVVDSIRELSATMTDIDALVLFPEGGNFTPSRRTRAIEKLDEIGRPALADRAREMQHLLPPKPTGALAAIEAAPTADVAFIGHVGLEELSTIRDLWRGIPMDTEVTARVWVVLAEDIPRPDEREHWLYDQWQVIDDWIASHLADETDTADPDSE